MVDDKKPFLVVPLTNLGSEVTSAELATGYVLRKISEEENNILRNKYFGRGPIITWSDFVLECRIPDDTRVVKSLNLCFKLVERAILLLRLFKEGMVGYNLIILKLPDVEHRLSLHRLPWTGADVRRSPSEYTIARKELRQLSDFFSQFIVMKNFGNMDLAAEYFNKSYEETYTPRDSIVDLMIALENVYLKGENMELGYKLATRISHVLSRDPLTRKYIFDKVKKAYALRSRIVHGTGQPHIDANVLFEIREYVRKSLIFFFKNPAVRNNLDELVLGIETISSQIPASTGCQQDLSCGQPGSRKG